MNKPNYEAIREWEAALRSGEFKQVRGALKKKSAEDTYCCLGVACNLYMRHHPEQYTWEDTDLRAKDGAYAMGIMPTEISKWLTGSPDGNPMLVAGKETFVAAFLNDDMGYTFEQIADAIRLTWPEAFEEKDA